MNNLIKVFLFCAIFSVYSCSTSKYYGDEKLGAGYILCKDGQYRSVDYSQDDNYRGDGGYAIIKENVKFINYNESHIIVQTSKYNTSANEIKTYWIIDKRVPITLSDFNSQEEFNKFLTAGLIGPLDSLGFYQRLKSEGINLKFENKK